MLQQGVYGADILYYYGDDANITGLFNQAHPALPEGYPFDYANSDVVANRLTSTGGRLTTASGMSYRMLVLDRNTERNTPLHVLRRIRGYVHEGAVVVGPKPIASPSNSDDQAEFKRIADELWGSGSGERTVGKGRVFAGMTAADAVKALKIVPDFEYVKPKPDTLLMFVHRKVSDGEVYWVDNRHDRDEDVEVTFRVAGKAPELWHADTGVVEPASYRIVNGRTVVPLRLNGDDAVFVVFRKPASAPSRTVPEARQTELATIDGSWDVAFQPNRGAPAMVTLDKLASWTENADAGVKVLLRHGHVYQDCAGACGVDQARGRALARSRQRGEHRRSRRQRQIGGRGLAQALPCEPDRRTEGRREHAGSEGGQRLGEPDNRRPAARRHEDHDGSVLPGRFALAAFRIVGARESGQSDQVTRHNPARPARVGVCGTP